MRNVVLLSQRVPDPPDFKNPEEVIRGNAARTAAAYDVTLHSTDFFFQQSCTSLP